MAILKSCTKSALVVCSLALLVAHSAAQDYPTKVVRYLVPGSTGSGGDILGRIVAAGLTQTFSQQVVVENRAGASGKIGAEIVAKSPPDGYLLLQIQIAHTLYASSARKPSFDLLRDFIPVTQLVASPYLVVVHPSLPVKSVGELIRLAKARPGQINYASAGPGSSTFIGTEIFKAATGINMVAVPYNGGGPTVIGIVSGECSVAILPVASSLSQVQQGRLRALAVTTDQRMSVVPELPTVAEAGVPGYEFSNWYGLVVPARTPNEVVGTIHRAALSSLSRPEVKKGVSDLAAIPVGSRPDQFAAYIKSEIALLKKTFPDRVID